MYFHICETKALNHWKLVSHYRREKKRKRGRRAERKRERERSRKKKEDKDEEKEDEKGQAEFFAIVHQQRFAKSSDGNSGQEHVTAIIRAKRYKRATIWTFAVVLHHSFLSKIERDRARFPR